MKTDLSQLIHLQTIDLRLKRVEAGLNALPQRRAEIEAEFESRAAEFRQLEQTLQTARGERAGFETQIEEARAQAERSERNLMSAKGEKDYGAAIREIDQARKQIAQFETSALERMELIEKTEAAIKEKEPEITQLRAETEARIKEFEAQTGADSSNIESLRRERDEIAATLPKNLLALYNRVSQRSRDHVAVTEARNYACASCSMSIRPHVMTEIKRAEEIVQCDNCSRILYFKPADQADQAATTTKTANNTTSSASVS